MEQQCELHPLEWYSKLLIMNSDRCQASIRTWERTVFGDSLMGLPFLRSVFAVFDYVSADMHSASPRLGIASMVDKNTAMKRYGEVYSKRLH